MPASFHFLDDVVLADLAFEAEGDSVPEVFEAASNAERICVDGSVVLRSGDDQRGSMVH